MICKSKSLLRGNFDATSVTVTDEDTCADTETMTSSDNDNRSKSLLRGNFDAISITVKDVDEDTCTGTETMTSSDDDNSFSSAEVFPLILDERNLVFDDGGNAHIEKDYLGHPNSTNCKYASLSLQPSGGTRHAGTKDKTSAPIEFESNLFRGKILLRFRNDKTENDISHVRCFSASTVADGKNTERNAVHRHTGILKQYSAGAFDLNVDADDEEALEKGNSVMKRLPPDDPTDKLGGKAICVQDINAPKKAVWRQILDMDSYVGKVNKVKECQNYAVETNDDGSIQIKTKMVIGVTPGYTYENYYDHRFSPKDDSITWSLDYKKVSDFDDIAGHWHVEDHPTKTGNTRVFYACDLKVKNPLPRPVVFFLQKTALKQATGWVKKESERNPNEVLSLHTSKSKASKRRT